MKAQLVEPIIKNVMNYQLDILNQKNKDKQNIIFNMSLFLILISIIFITLYIKYKGQQDEKTKKEKENRKRDYILSNLRKYQNMKNQPLTNIPL